MTIQPKTHRRRWAALAIVPLTLAACGDDDSDTATGAGGGEGGGGGGGGGGGDELSIDVVSPTDGEAVGDTFDLEFDLGVDVGEPDTGRHHVHVYYDGQTEGSPGEDYDLVYEDSFTVERDLGPGEHQIEAVIANADHSLTDARDSLTVTVGEPGAEDDSGEEEPSDGDDGGETDISDGYDY